MIYYPFRNYSGGTQKLAKPPFHNCSVVPHICSFGTSKYTRAIREGQVSLDSEMDEDGVLLNSYSFSISECLSAKLNAGRHGRHLQFNYQILW